MALDRDLGVAVLRARSASLGRRLSGWEMLSATGARGLRLLSESGAMEGLWLTEANPLAFSVLLRNAQPFLPQGARVRLWDATEPLPEGPFDFVDVDPFGTPVPFVGAALSALAEGGLVAVTATDLPVLAGVQAATCLSRYGGRPVRGRLGPEGGLRILLAYLGRRAESASRGFHPLLSYVLGHHVRVYAELTGPARPLPIAEVRGGDGEGAPLPGPGPYGPLWTGALFDAGFVGRLEVPEGVAHPKELHKLLERFRDESAVDVPFYYEPNRLARATGVDRPPALGGLLEELRRRGYRAGRSHTQPSAFRTDAPRREVEAAVRQLADAA